MMKNRFRIVHSFALAMLASSAALAAPVIYFGENQTAGLSVSGSPVAARAQFLSNLSGVSSQGFESFAVGRRAPIDLTFAGSAGSLSATLTGVGQVDNSTAFGRFNTTTGGSNVDISMLPMMVASMRACSSLLARGHVEMATGRIARHESSSMRGLDRL